jgi:hypothetical protein
MHIDTFPLVDENEVPYEARVFRRPDGKIGVGTYADSTIPHSQPQDGTTVHQPGNPVDEVFFRLRTGGRLSDYV